MCHELDREEKMDKVQKLVTTGITVGAGMLGGKLVDFIWLKATGSKAPRKAGLPKVPPAPTRRNGMQVTSCMHGRPLPPHPRPFLGLQ